MSWHISEILPCSTYFNSVSVKSFIKLSCNINVIHICRLHTFACIHDFDLALIHFCDTSYIFVIYYILRFYMNIEIVFYIGKWKRALLCFFLREIASVDFSTHMLQTFAHIGIYDNINPIDFKWQPLFYNPVQLMVPELSEVTRSSCNKEYKSRNRYRDYM